jgi:hypothetical protein
MKDLHLILIILVLSGVLYLQTQNKKEGFYDGSWFNPEINKHMTQRSKFNTNLDPRYQFAANRNDPFATGGYIRGASPNEKNLGSMNDFRGDSSHEGFGEVLRGEYPGTVDAGSVITRDFAAMGSNFSVEADKTAQKPNTLEYTSPKELLPTPDMRSNAIMRDPSDPTNFMYDRTLFAPLKRRNRNEVDFFRGDLDITPLKIGYFDVATNPRVDLGKGYFGYYNDTEQFQDLQDITNSYRRDTEDGKMKATPLMNAITNDLVNGPLKHQQAWAQQPDLQMPFTSPFGVNGGVLNM